VVFDAIPYTEADIGQTYTYWIVEVEPTVPETGMTYDPMVIEVTVAITDAGNGVLNVVPTYSADTIFNNSYTASGNVVLEADKALAGRTLKAGEFSFQLKQGTTVLHTRRNDWRNITFDAILRYTEADIGQTYTYRRAIEQESCGQRDRV
jgi:pilin isopeptide linkage protein